MSLVVRAISSDSFGHLVCCVEALVEHTLQLLVVGDPFVRDDADMCFVGESALTSFLKE